MYLLGCIIPGTRRWCMMQSTGLLHMFAHGPALRKAERGMCGISCLLHDPDRLGRRWLVWVSSGGEGAGSMVLRWEEDQVV